MFNAFVVELAPSSYSLSFLHHHILAPEILYECNLKLSSFAVYEESAYRVPNFAVTWSLMTVCCHIFTFCSIGTIIINTVLRTLELTFSVHTHTV